MIDIHSHILPGLDDGPHDIAESLKMAKMCVTDGVDRIVGTPHVFCDVDNPSRSDIEDCCRSFAAEFMWWPVMHTTRRNGFPD